MDFWKILVICLLPVMAYLLGSISGAVIISKCFYKQDIREYGSKNAGMTNALRVYGIKAALGTLAIDLGKAAVSVIAAKLILHFGLGILADTSLFLWVSCITAFVVVVGHIKPIWFQFRGGKGVLTTLGVWLFIDWRAGLLAFAVFLIVVLLTKYVSLGSIIGMVSFFGFSLLFGLLGEYATLWAPVVVSFVIAAVSIFMHRGNIVRLANGTESKIGRGGKKKEA